MSSRNGFATSMPSAVKFVSDAPSTVTLFGICRDGHATWSFVVGRKRFVVIDAASKDESEQRKLFELIDSFIEKDFLQEEMIISVNLSAWKS